MWRKLLIVISVLIFAFGVLSLSVFRSASVRYDFGESNPLQSIQMGEDEVGINYYLPYPGGVLPDSPFWPLKSARDKLWLTFTTSLTRKAELKLLFADKRLGASSILFEKGKPEIGLSTLTKAEKYLEEASREELDARRKGLETSQLLVRLANASLKHYAVIKEIEEIAPDEARPIISEVANYSKTVFEGSRNALLEKNISPPENPFDW